MRPIASDFALEVFDRGNARSARLGEFLTLYVQHMSPAHRTKTNELIEFLENPPPDRSIFYFGLTYRGERCGFATLMHYPEGPIAIIDHLVIAPNKRGYGAFFGFSELITSFVESKNLPFDHIVAEVMLEERQLATHMTPTILVRLIRWLGFKAAKMAYWAPDPSITRDRKGCKAVLMVASSPERHSATAEEMYAILEVIYLSHYLKWYERTMEPDQFAKYAAVAREVLAETRELIFQQGSIVLNGMKNFDLAYAIDRDNRPDATTLGYIALVAVPIVISIAVAAVQEIWVTLISGAISVAVVLLFAFHPKLRHWLLRFFRLAE